MNDHDPPQEPDNPLTPLIGTIISDFSQRHDLAEVIALHARLAEVCGDDTLLNIVCDQTGCHLHVTTFAIGECCQPSSPLDHSPTSASQAFERKSV